MLRLIRGQTGPRVLPPPGDFPVENMIAPDHRIQYNRCIRHRGGLPMKQEYITIISKRVKKKIRTADILYIIKSEYLSLIHLLDGEVLQTIASIQELEEMLGDDCIEVKRGCIVSVSAITDIKDKISLCNGETIDYTRRKKKALRMEWQEKKKRMIHEIIGQNPPRTNEEYHQYYKICDNFPFAFTDIEMVFNEKRRAVDWIFRYGNEALAELEGVPLERLTGSTFSSLFDNMDAKWLRAYERTALYGETMEIEEYSPEIDANLRILCFPTFPGHCGCILHDMDRLQSMKYENWFGMTNTTLS